MYPEQLAAPSLANARLSGSLTYILDVPLFWQCWKLDSRMVEAVTAVVRSAANDLRRGRKYNS